MKNETAVVDPSDPAWVVVDGQRGHRVCAANYNSTITCGIDHGDCHSRQCCFSAAYTGAPGPRQQLYADVIAAWLRLTREQRARALGQELSERRDGACVRRSHEDGVCGSGLFAHVASEPGALQEALRRLLAQVAS